jgi:hypothetical protein
MHDKTFSVTRTGDFVIIPKAAVGAIKEIGAEAFSIFSVLCMYANDSCVKVRLDDLCNASGLSLNTVRKALKTLLKANMLHVKASFNDQGRQTANTYTVNDNSSQWTLPNFGTLPNSGTLPKFGRASTIHDLNLRTPSSIDLESINKERTICKANCSLREGTESELAVQEKSPHTALCSGQSSALVCVPVLHSNNGQTDEQKLSPPSMHCGVSGTPLIESPQDFSDRESRVAQNASKTGRRGAKKSKAIQNIDKHTEEASKPQKRAKERKTTRDMQKVRQVQGMMLSFLYGEQETYSKSQWAAVVGLYESIRLPDCEIEPEVWKAYEAFWASDDWLSKQRRTFALVKGKEKGFAAWYSRHWLPMSGLERQEAPVGPNPGSDGSGWISRRVLEVGPDGVGRIKVVWERAQ